MIMTDLNMGKSKHSNLGQATEAVRKIDKKGTFKSDDVQSLKTEDNFDYREVSEISDATDDVFTESPNIKDPDADLNDYNRLVHNTQQRLQVLGKLDLFNA